MLVVLAFGVVTVFLLSSAGNALSQSPQTARQRPSPTATGAAPSGLPSGVLAAQVKSYPVAPDNAGLMQPAVDGQGNIWFGEMATNKLARLNPSTGTVDTWQPPNGRYNVMAVAIDAHGAVWFTEQAANYIGRFDPATQQFKTYPLAQVSGHGVSPQSLVFDSHGVLWFTEIAGAIGRLDPATGTITTWKVPAPRSNTPSYPYSIAVAPSGEVWVGLLTGGALARLNPATGDVKLVLLPDPQAQLFSMAADSTGRIWFSELQSGKIGMVDTRTAAVQEFAVPQTLGDPAGLYALTVTANGDVWVACAAANALIRFTPTSAAFTLYALPIAQSVPFGLAQSSSGTLWFTADAQPANYVGAFTPA